MTIAQDVRTLSRREFERMPADDLIAVYRRNLEALLAYHMSTDVPYFGLHGTTKEGLEHIRANGGEFLNVTTFYDKERSKRRLFQLMSMCHYASAYTRKDRCRTGGILVFDMEKDGRNISYEWEHLKGGLWCLRGLGIHSEDEEEVIRGFLSDENHLCRSTIELYGDNFKTRHKGTIPFEGKREEQYSSGLKTIDDFLLRESLRVAVRSQDVLASAYEALER
jgi:hypothetical protein